MKITFLVCGITLLASTMIGLAQDAASTPFHGSSTPAPETTPPPAAQPTPALTRSTPTPPAIPLPTPPPPVTTPTPQPAATAVRKADSAPRATAEPLRASARTRKASPKPPVEAVRELSEDNRDDHSSAGGVVKALEKEWEASIAKHDTTVIERLVADDFIGVSSSGKIGDKVALVYEAKRDKNIYKTAAARQMSVRTFGPHVAVVLGITRESGTDASGRAFDHTFRFTDTWMERAGKWQCIAAHAAVATRQ